MTRIAILVSCILAGTFAGTGGGHVAFAADQQIEALARSHFDKGRKLSDEHHYLEALSEFSAGYELSQKPLFLFNMAECSRSLGNMQRALDDYKRYVAADPNGKLAPLAHDRITELQSALTTPPPVQTPVEQPAQVQPRAEPVAPGGTEPARVELVAVAPTPAPRPIWKRTGFWVGIGAGAAAVIIVGGVVGWAVNRNSGACGGVSSCADLR